MNEKIKQMLEEYNEHINNKYYTLPKEKREKCEEFHREVDKLKKQQEIVNELRNDILKIDEELSTKEDAIYNLERTVISVSLESILKEVQNIASIQNLGEMQLNNRIQLFIAKSNVGPADILKEQLELLKNGYLPYDGINTCIMSISFPAAKKRFELTFHPSNKTIQKDGKPFIEHIKVKPYANSKDDYKYCIDDYNQIICEKSFGQIYGCSYDTTSKVLITCIRAIIEKETANNNEIETTDNVVVE